MKTPLSVFGCLLAASFLSARPPEPSTLVVRSGPVFEKMAAGLEASKLLGLYGSHFKIKQISKNRHDPSMRDTVLSARTAADQVVLFKNSYNAFLLSADLTSSKVDFGQGIRIGASQAAFCRAFHLRPNYQTYVITDAPEEAVQLRFRFAGGTLKQVSYRLLRPYTDID